MNHPQRLHTLDNLRAVMMWLGIVLHVAAIHMVGEPPLPWHDAERSMLANLVVTFIHAFRMPVFFMLSGFFVAMLVSRRGYGGMLKHRLRRIGLPFLIFWPLIFVGSLALILVYVHLMVTGTVGLDPALMQPDPDRPLIGTMHMWFIYYLLWFCCVTALAGVFSEHLAAGFRKSVSGCWLVLASKWWGFVVLVAPLAVIGAFYKDGIVTASGSFMPKLGEFAHNGLFFVFGWYLYQHQEGLLELYAKCCWRYALAGLFFLMAFIGLYETIRMNPGTIPHHRFWLAFNYNCVSWLWSFALIGIFVRYLQNQNRFLRYISESSYWVYLVHFPCTIGFGILLYQAPFNALSKMGLNILATTLVCLATYHVLVRYSPIGTLLSGQRYTFGSKTCKMTQ
ncbi:MAG: acyltransferase family protein [Proteobacteria bacterium]|nr:acyltransferase family protein [Pseudomonadota bacterium]